MKGESLATPPIPAMDGQNGSKGDKGMRGDEGIKGVKGQKGDGPPQAGNISLFFCTCYLCPHMHLIRCMPIILINITKWTFN